MNIPRALVIHDLASFGKVAFSTVIPIMTASGVEVIPLANAFVSSNVIFPGYQIVDLTEHMEPFLQHFRELELKFDCIYTGFLASYEQAEICKKAIKEFDPGLVLIDPVFGEDGIIYPTMTGDFIESMKDLVSVAHVTTPNLTEACYLAGIPYDEVDGSTESLIEIAKEIHKMGAKKIMITGVKREEDYVIFLSRGGKYKEINARYLPYTFHGTGDAYASLIIGEYYKGKSWEESVQFAADYISFIIEESVKYEDFSRRGLMFEPYLHMLSPSVETKF